MKPPLFFIVGNKVDLDKENERAVEKEDAKKFRSDYPMPWKEMTAKSKDHVDSRLEEIRDIIAESMQMKTSSRKARIN